MTSFPRETFGSRMKRYRKFRSYTQSALAQAVGASQASVSKFEHDSLSPDVYVAIRISALLRFPLKGLVRKP
jgi:DNA-binding XRE family transcriptional regulator